MHRIKVTRTIIAANPDARILMFSVNDTEDDMHQALEAGARGYMPKSSEEDATIHAICQVSTRHDFPPAQLASTDRTQAVTIARQRGILRR